MKLEIKITPLGWLTIIVTLLFVTLKLTDQIDWSWWEVFLPLIVHYAVWFLLLALAAGVRRAERRARLKRR